MLLGVTRSLRFGRNGQSPSRPKTSAFLMMRGSDDALARWGRAMLSCGLEMYPFASGKDFLVIFSPFVLNLNDFVPAL